MWVWTGLKDRPARRALMARWRRTRSAVCQQPPCRLVHSEDLFLSSECDWKWHLSENEMRASVVYPHSQLSSVLGKYVLRWLFSNADLVFIIYRLVWEFARVFVNRFIEIGVRKVPKCGCYLVHIASATKHCTWPICYSLQGWVGAGKKWTGYWYLVVAMMSRVG